MRLPFIKNNYLEYGLHQNEGFIVVTGDVGTGKTTLIRSLLSKLDSKKVVAAQLVSTQLDAEDTLRLVCAAFGLPAKDIVKSDALLSLEKFLRSLSRDGKRALLIIDEAQNLTPRAVEELRMLSNFQVGTNALVQSFLVGQPEFRETMCSPHMQQLRQRVIASCHISPLSSEDTKGYVEHRLRHAGWTNDPVISEKLFAVPWHALTLDTEHKRFVLNVEKHRLQNAPGFDKDKWPNMADQSWANEIHSYYGTKPYSNDQQV